MSLFNNVLSDNFKLHVGLWLLVFWLFLDIRKLPLYFFFVLQGGSSKSANHIVSFNHKWCIELTTYPAPIHVLRQKPLECCLKHDKLSELQNDYYFRSAKFGVSICLSFLEFSFWLGLKPSQVILLHLCSNIPFKIIFFFFQGRSSKNKTVTFSSFVARYETAELSQKS